ncbi:hypothetical protein BH20BAC1_BH20BAC1_13160 [soil metagenome]
MFKVVTLITVASFFTVLSAQAQSSPKLKFRQPTLISGVNGEVGGALLVNIDDSLVGYYDAWQPTVGGPDALGSSYIKWDVQFKSSLGTNYFFATLDASAIDIDGDNAYISEFSGVNGQSSYDVPSLIPTLLTIESKSDTDNINGDDPSLNNLWAYGPITNRYDIDTSSEDVRINYHFTEMSKIKFYTGSTVHGTGGALNRYHCIYFMDIANATWSVLPVVYHSFDAVLGKDAVNLYWSVNSEFANDQFEIERSFDQINFVVSGLILGANSTANGINQYSFPDKNADIFIHQVIYYRLRQVNQNGNYTYSSVKMVRLPQTLASKATVQVMPNPYMDKLNISFESNDGGQAEIRLLNASGAVIKKLSSSINKGVNNFQLQDLHNQTPGMYVVNILVNGKSVDTRKIIKQ